MKIHSVLGEQQITLFDEDLLNYPEDRLIRKEIKEQKQDAFEATCCLKLSCKLCIIKTQFRLHQRLNDQFGVEGDFVQVSCLFKGDSMFQNRDSETKLEMGKVYLTSQTASLRTISMPAVCTKYICILISKAFFLNLLKDENWVEEDLFYQRVKNCTCVPFGEMGVPLDFQLYQGLRDMVDCDWSPRKQLSYVQIKIRELFLQLHYQRQGPTEVCKGYTDDTLEKIKQARAYLAVNYDQPPTINALSRIVLLNEVQLKAGFKDFYGCTIRAYITDLRMKKAFSLISTYSVNETAGILGYKSVSHFISSFKKYYGQTPKQMRLKK